MAHLRLHIALAGLALSTAFAACSSPTVNEAGGSPALDTGFVETLRAKAQALAEAELARFAAGELLYRNMVVRSETRIPIVEQITGGYHKIYRRFSGYELKDIYRSDSLLTPITFEIEYRYDLLSTPYRPMEDRDSPALARKDMDFDVLRRDEILVRRYPCDAEGNYVGGLNELPPRPSYHVGEDPKDPEGAPPNALPNAANVGSPQAVPQAPAIPGAVPGGALSPAIPNL